MTGMVDKVAKAIFDVSSVEGVTSWEKISRGSRDLHIEWARAAIEAMMEPTEFVADIGFNKILTEIQIWDVERGIDYSVNDEIILNVWREMIQAALKEEVQ